MLAVPGVTSADNASWETWYVTDNASGEALCQAAATVVDELADPHASGIQRDVRRGLTIAQPDC